MQRTLIYDINTVAGLKEYDFLTGELTGFQYKNAPAYHRVTGGEVGRFDLIAYQYYQNEDWWWIIAAANEIVDPMNEIIVGKRLVIPNILDIWDYFNSRRKR